ncbi:unnamed protein product [Closterium sp. NIES-53]
MGSSSQIDVSQKLRESDDLLKQGDAVLDNGDIETAIQLFGSALESRVAAFGELGEECAVAYFKYASALFAKSQRDTDVLGPAGQKLEQGKEEEEDVEAEEDEASKSKGKGKGKVEETEDAPDGADGAEEEDLEEAEEGDEEEEGDQELAWRLLETARCIYAKRDARSLEEVDVISTLADLSLEKEDFDSCMEDYQHALNLLSLLVSPHHRRVIELYFKMALANQTGNRATEALRCCRQAIDACEKRVAQAQTLLEAKRKLTAAGKEGGESVATGSAAAAEGASVGVEVTKVADEAAGKEVKGEAKGEEESKEEKKEEEKDEAKAGEGTKSSVDKGKGKAEEGAGIPYDSIDGRSSEEELVQEIQDVRQIASDLKEKAEELQEMIRLPSVEAMMREQLSAVFSGTASSSAPPTTAAAASAAPAATSAPVAAAPTAAAPAATASGLPSAAAAAAAGGSKAREGEQRGEKRAAEVAVVGRSKKRLTPVPVPPEEAAVLSWPGVAS